VNRTRLARSSIPSRSSGTSSTSARYVSQRILEAHGGHLDIKQGRAEVSFTATLPVTQL
jgi:hypothetical protein